MAKVKIIARVGVNYEIASERNFIFDFPQENDYCIRLMQNCFVITSKNMLDTLPSRILKRVNLALSPNDLSQNVDVISFNNVKKVMKFIRDNDKDLCVIGDEELYEKFLPYADEIYMTEVDKIYSMKREEDEKDPLFPTFDKTEWVKNDLSSSCEYGINYSHKRYVKRK